jgi:predicted nuclease of predicted toxin-antitoxin system
VKFLLDENFPRKADSILIASGHEVFDVRDIIKPGSNDEKVFYLAQKLDAVILTTDKDFYHTIPMQYGRKHCGAIIIALNKPNGPALLHKLQTVLNFLHNFTIKSNVILFTDNRVYIPGRHTS